MLLAIDVGNTHTVFGAWNGAEWVGLWRRSTNIEDTEDQLAAWLKTIFDLAGLAWRIDEAYCCSVVPAMDQALSRLCEKWLGTPLLFLRSGCDVGLEVTYEPPHAVGADRIANAIAGLAKYEPPIIVVDFGTATTFDSIGRNSAYLGGAILPGVKLSSQALFSRAAKLPQVDYVAPEKALGTNTVHSLQSGIMIGYAGAIDALARRIDQEMGGRSRILSTGGLGKLFLGICESIEAYEPTLTLDGLVIASKRLALAARADR
ncbi:MAG TPA: type III pantothenate kinase [Fimbriimonas sp.]|nr:type III pantothenate kinase [Fimbriimonas sp.]